MKKRYLRLQGFLFILFLLCYMGGGTVSEAGTQASRTVQETKVDVSKDGVSIIYLKLENIQPNAEIKMPTWSENYSQDDIIWYQAGVHSQFSKGNFTLEGKSYNYRLIVNKDSHKNATYGLFHSHLYINNVFTAGYDYQITGGTGYQVNFHNYGCTRYVCSTGGDGQIVERSLGQWYEPCLACVNKGRPNNDLFIMQASMQYYYCYHYPTGFGHIGAFYLGQCQYNKGWARADGRVSSFSHDYYFCPGHRAANTYTIKYNSNGGSGEMGDSVFQFDTEKRLSKNLFQREGFRFLGWTRNQDSAKPEYQEEQAMKNLTPENGAVFTLYALWEEMNPNPPTIQAEDIYIHKGDTDTTATKELLLSKVNAEDIEDGDLTGKIIVQNLDEVLSKSSQEFTQEEIYNSEKVIEIQYTITDSGGKGAETNANLHIIYPAQVNGTANGYVRFIQESYVNDLPGDSRWADKKEVLREILRKTGDGIRDEQL